MKRLFLMMVVWACVTTAVSAQQRATEATITSDELELQNNGDITTFRGHVVLSQEPYQVRADRMTRQKADGLVNADGHVIGTWVSPKGEKVRLEGDQARYDPTAETVDLWGPRRVAIQIDGEKGKASFLGDRGWISTHTPGKARLSGQVTGHVIPRS